MGRQVCQACHHSHVWLSTQKASSALADAVGVLPMPPEFSPQQAEGGLLQTLQLSARGL